jgi:hypothetical protein
MMEKSGLVYEFSCPCNEKYIGETRRSLGVRSKEHAMSHFYLSWPMTDKNSAIFNHIRSCPKFLEKFDEYWSEPNTKYSDLSHNKRMGLFTPKFFTILKSNLSNESDRKITEAILIKLFNPSCFLFEKWTQKKPVLFPVYFSGQISEFLFPVLSCKQKEEEEELIEHFLELQIDENKAAALVHDQEIQDPEVLNEEKPSSAKDP